MSIVLSMLKQLIATRVKKPDAEAILQSLKGSVSGGPAPPVDPADLETVLEALPALRRRRAGIAHRSRGRVRPT
jgi:hypothetical protein